MEDELMITLLREKTVYAGDVRTTIDQGIVRLLQYLVWINDTQINESLEWNGVLVTVAILRHWKYRKYIMHIEDKS